MSLLSTNLPEVTLVVALATGGFACGSPASFGDAGDDLLSVSAFGPKHLSLFSPTGDPSKPGTGTTLLFYGSPSAHPEPRPAARTSPRRDETVVPFGRLLISLGSWGQHDLYLWRLAKRSPALQACNRMRNSQADGVPRGTRLRRPNQVSGVFCLWLSPSRSPEFMP